MTYDLDEEPNQIKNTFKDDPNKIKVYQDEKNNTNDICDYAPNPSDNWPDFGTEASKHKENTVYSTAWHGEVLPQKTTSRQIKTEKLEVYKDTVFFYLLFSYQYQIKQKKQVLFFNLII